VNTSAQLNAKIRNIAKATGVSAGTLHRNFMLERFLERVASSSLLTYNIETVLAEKFETVISRGVANTRMKDFYDICVLSSGQSVETDPYTFSTALKNTANQRHTLKLLPNASRIIDTIAGSADMARLWKQYQSDNPYAANIDFQTAVAALRKLAEWSAIEKIMRNRTERNLV
jgi:hypothetical protein